MTPVIFELGETVKSKKKHPCGGTEWIITRTGVETDLKCTTCGRLIMLETAKARKMFRKTGE